MVHAYTIAITNSQDLKYRLNQKQTHTQTTKYSNQQITTHSTTTIIMTNGFFRFRFKFFSFLYILIGQKNSDSKKIVF